VIYLLDTNVCIHLLKVAESPVWERLRRMNSTLIAVYDIVKAELYR
jgi:predicted nucleic acid-binding protein